MPAKITITHVGFSNVPATNQTCSFYYKLQSEPVGSFQLVSNNVAVLPNGNLVTPLVISGLAYNTIYTVRCVNNCNNSTVDENFDTGPVSPATTSTTTAAATTSTTTEAEVTTTIPPLSGLTLEKNGVSQDYLVAYVTPVGGGATQTYEFLSSDPGTSKFFPDVFNNTQLYHVAFGISPYGRPNAPMGMNDGTGNLVASSPASTNIEANDVNPAPGGVYCSAGL